MCGSVCVRVCVDVYVYVCVCRCVCVLFFSSRPQSEAFVESPVGPCINQVILSLLPLHSRTHKHKYTLWNAPSPSLSSFLSLPLSLSPSLLSLSHSLSHAQEIASTYVIEMPQSLRSEIEEEFRGILQKWVKLGSLKVRGNLVVSLYFTSAYATHIHIHTHARIQTHTHTHTHTHTCFLSRTCLVSHTHP